MGYGHRQSIMILINRYRYGSGGGVIFGAINLTRLKFIRLSPVSKDISRCHKSKKHSSPPAKVSAFYDNRYIRKRTGMRRSALFLLYCARSRDILLPRLRKAPSWHPDFEIGYAIAEGAYYRLDIRNLGPRAIEGDDSVSIFVRDGGGNDAR